MTLRRYVCLRRGHGDDEECVYSWAVDAG